ncbi:ATP-binding protein [Novosphingopyxis sp.]|uniref:ATP-binding protein n=1 Tax=Novosphingopyxis sp. TaxID=2709690 RepID=UPI003B5BB418
MSRFSLLRLALAALLLLTGAIMAGYSTELAERSFIMIVSGMIALFVASDQGGGKARARPPRQIPSAPGRITHHPDFQAFIDASTDPVLLVEAARVTNANRAAQRLLGENVIGENVRTAVRHAGAAERLADDDAQHEGRPLRLTGIGLRDQSWDMRISRIGSGQKLVQLTDRTSSQAAEKMRVDFVANASHELMTPISSIKGFIETLSEPDAGGSAPTRTRFLGIMAAETDRMQVLVRDLMSLSRIEAEKYQPVETSVDLADIAVSVAGELAAGSNPRGRDIVLDGHERPLTVMGDTSQLRQLLYNVLSNAMKYGRQGTPIMLSLGLSRSGSMARLRVTDEGEGIAPEHIPRLTERFYRVDSGRSRQLGGTGLGLSLVKHIVDRHRGHLEIASEQGEGTAINVMLQIARADAHADPETGANEGPG